MLLSVERVVKVLLFLFRGLWLLLFGNVEWKRFWWDAAAADACGLALEVVELSFLLAAEALMGRRRHDGDVVIT